MNEQAHRLSDRLAAFNNELIAFVEQCSDEALQTNGSEDWPLVVVARHIGAGHYAAVVDLTQMIVAGQPLPEFTVEALTQMANDHAQKHADCTKAQVLTILRENGAKLHDYAASLSDEDLQRTTHMDLLGGKVTAGQFIEAIILHSAAEHFASMKKAVGNT